MLALAITAALSTGPDFDQKIDVINETVEALTLPHMEVETIYEKCGQVNAYYSPRRHRFIMCFETMNEPLEVIRFITAHEMGHAVIDQWHIPITGSEEAAADEYAAVSLLALGHEEAPLEMAVWYLEHPDGGEDVDDPHQSARKRAAVIACLADGSEGEHSAKWGCEEAFNHATLVWLALLTTFSPED